MTLLIDRNLLDNQPAVHVLIVGVGEYPHLQGGAGKPFANNAGMGQLTSPPISASSFAEWLKKNFEPFGAELGSIAVLCSGNASFVDDSSNPVYPHTANLTNLIQSVYDWYERGNKHEDNQMIFYFCGHGATSGIVNSLLLSNFGENKLDPFGTGAFDADGFMNGMRKCKAKHQLYLFDACRSVPQNYLRDFGSKGGADLIAGSAHENLGIGQQVCLWASELGLSAFARPGENSVFMDGLLLAMLGSGSLREDDGSWHIQARSLEKGINVFIEGILGKEEKQFVTPGRLSSSFPIHVLSAPPMVPIKVTSVPANIFTEIEIKCNSGHSKPIGTDGPWRLDLPYGVYKMSASMTAGGVVVSTEDCLATPPCQTVPLKIY